MLDAKGLEAAARKLRNAEKEKFGSWPDADDSKSIAAAAITAYLQAVGPEPAVAGVETCKFYHSQWPVEDRLKARGPYGLITDDGEAWRYEYTHSDADGGPYDVVCRPRSALVATSPAEPVVEALTYDWNGCTDMPVSRPDLSDFEVAAKVRMLMRDQLDHEFVCTLARDRIMGLSKRVAALATKPAIKDDETVVLPRLTDDIIRAACKAHFGTDNADGVCVTVGDRDWTFRDAFKRMWSGARATLAAKDGRS